MHLIKIVIKILLFTSTIFSQQSLIKNYTSVDGLPTSTIYSSAQSDDGNMWFASESGLIEYNGQTWVLYDSLGSFPANNSMHFVEYDSVGILWSIPRNANDPIFFRKDGEWFTAGIPSEKNFTIASYNINRNDTENGTDIVLVTRNPILLISRDGGRIFKEIQFQNLNKIYDAKFINSYLILATDQGLFKYDYISEKLNSTVFFSEDPVYHIDIHSAPDKVFLLSDNWIGELENDTINILANNFDLQFYKDHENSQFLRKTPNGKFYFGTKFQLLRYSPYNNQVQHFEEFEKLAIYGATSVFVDYEKNTWFTTYRGIVKIRYTPFTILFNPDQLLEKEVTSISKFPKGDLILSHNGGFTILDKSTGIIKKISFDNQSADDFSRVLYSHYDRHSNLVWFNSQLLGIGAIDQNKNLSWVIKNSNDDKKNFMSFYISKQNRFFFATTNFLFEFDNDKRTDILLNTVLFLVRQIADYDSNKLIIASKSGLYIYNIIKREYTNFSYTDRNKNNIYSILKLDDKNWLVGSQGGLLFFDGKQLKEFPDLKIDAPIFFIERENDHIWFGLMGGALRWNPATGEQKMFTIKEGLAGVETNRDAFLFDDYKVYIGTENGLSIFLPEAYHPEYYKIKPKINFIGITDLKGACYSIDKELDFSYSNNDILVKYISPSFIDETSMNYTIVLSNIDENTTEAFNTTETSYYIRNLASDTYRVGISAINPNGISSDTVYSANIVIRPPFYLETWFLSLVLIFSISVTYSIYNYIMKVRYSKILQQKVDERTRQLRQSEISIRELTQRVFTAQEEQSEKIARDLHDHIAQDMALIQLEIEKILKSSNNNNDKNHAWLTDKVAELTSYMRDLAYFLHPNTIKQTGFVNSVQSLCKDFCSHSNIEIEFFSNLEQSFSITDEAATNIYRVIQEGLWNIRKHSGANSGIVIVLQRDKSLIVRIEDDGKGFEVESTINNPVKKSMGLRSMEERIIYLKGEFSIKSVLTEGTKLKATIPLAALNQSIPDTNLDQPSGS